MNGKNSFKLGLDIKMTQYYCLLFLLPCFVYAKYFLLLRHYESHDAQINTLLKEIIAYLANIKHFFSTESQSYKLFFQLINLQIFQTRLLQVALTEEIS